MTETAKLEALIGRLRKRIERVHDLSGVSYNDDEDCHLAADAIEMLLRALSVSRPAVKDEASLAASVMRITAKIEGLFGYIDMSQDGAKEAWADWCAEKETAWSLSLSSLSPPTGGWKPIASAPRDRTPIIIAVPTKDLDDHIVGEAYFDPDHDDGDWWWAGTGHGDYHGGPISEMNHHLPTHWQPLPSPPEAE